MMIALPPQAEKTMLIRLAHISGSDTMFDYILVLLFLCSSLEEQNGSRQNTRKLYQEHLSISSDINRSCYPLFSALEHSTFVHPETNRVCRSILKVNLPSLSILSWTPPSSFLACPIEEE